MTEFLTSDEHYWHEAIIEFCDRPFKNIENMNNSLIRLHNEVVGPDDIVYHLGDLFWWGPQKQSKLESIIQKLNGEHHLILGNHDRLKPFTYIEYGFTSVHTSLVLHDRYVLAHDPAIATLLKPGQTLLCGHVHQLFRKVSNAYNVGVDIHDYKPVALEAITAEIVRSSAPPPPIEK